MSNTNDAGQCAKRRIHVADFDGTITRADSLLAFIIHAKGRVALFAALLLYSPLLVMMKLRLVEGGKVKERLFGRLFGGMPAERFDDVCRDFARRRADLLRPSALNHLRAALSRGESVYVVTASLGAWVRPLLEEALGAGRAVVVSTEAQTADGRMTGRFATPNCYGAEKVRRLKAILPDRQTLHIIAYGDSRGDKQMFDYADETHFKPFS